MNASRLFVLAELATQGPLYGHQIRRSARVDRTELWSAVKPGTLYAALHRLYEEGLIEEVRREQPGNMPARTVYAITAEGRRELRSLRAEAFRELTAAIDPVDLALATSGELDEDTIRGFVEDRVAALEARAAMLRHEAERARPERTVADELVIAHSLTRVEAELAWHHIVLDRVGKLVADAHTE